MALPELTRFLHVVFQCIFAFGATFSNSSSSAPNLPNAAIIDGSGMYVVQTLGCFHWLLVVATEKLNRFLMQLHQRRWRSCAASRPLKSTRKYTMYWICGYYFHVDLFRFLKKTLTLLLNSLEHLRATRLGLALEEFSKFYVEYVMIISTLDGKARCHKKSCGCCCRCGLFQRAAAAKTST